MSVYVIVYTDGTVKSLSEPWSKVAPQVQGVKGIAGYKKFPTIESSRGWVKHKLDFLASTKNVTKNQNIQLTSDNKDKFIVFVDGGSLGMGGELFIGAWAICWKASNGTYLVRTGAEINKTNNQMEITAIKQALSYAHKNNYSEIEIYTDSQYCRNAIMDKTQLVTWIAESKQIKNRRLWEEIYYLLNQFKKYTVNHVRAHTGIEMNEIVDSVCTNQMYKYIREVPTINKYLGRYLKEDETVPHNTLIHQEELIID